MLSSALQIVLQPCPDPHTFPSPCLLFPRHWFSSASCRALPDPCAAACGAVPVPADCPVYARCAHIKGDDGRKGLKLCPVLLKETLCAKAMCGNGGSRVGASSCYREVGPGICERCGHSPPGPNAETGWQFSSFRSGKISQLLVVCSSSRLRDGSMGTAKALKAHCCYLGQT